MKTMKVANVSTGFLDIPGQISLNVFAQGCKLHCKDCQSPELQPFVGGRDFSFDGLQLLLNDRPMIKWICWTGGDSTFQPKVLNTFTERIKSMNYYNGVYTGRYFEDLTDIDLTYIDLIIDGPYKKDCGSVDMENTNQRCFLKKDDKFFQFKFNELEPQIKQIMGEKE